MRTGSQAIIGQHTQLPAVGERSHWLNQPQTSHVYKCCNRCSSYLSTASANGMFLSAAAEMPCPCVAWTAACSALSLSSTQGLSCRFDRQRVRVVLEVSWPASSTRRRLLVISTSVSLHQEV